MHDILAVCFDLAMANLNSAVSRVGSAVPRTTQNRLHSKTRSPLGEGSRHRSVSAGAWVATIADS